MADKQYDIWNDDDGETEAKKSRGSRRILFFGLVLALVLAVVLVAAYRDGTGFDALRRYFSYRNQTDGEQVGIPLRGVLSESLRGTGRAPGGAV